jgi:hypothetical protein
MHQSLTNSYEPETYYIPDRLQTGSSQLPDTCGAGQTPFCCSLSRTLYSIAHDHFVDHRVQWKPLSRIMMLLVRRS